VGGHHVTVTQQFIVCLLVAPLISQWHSGVTPLKAQTLRGDLTAANRYIWRGINRTTTWVLQPGAAAAIPVGRGGLALGVFESRELGHADPEDLTEVGHGQKGLGERDWWLEYRRPVGSQEMFLGITRYTFHGDQALGGRSSAENTTEIGLGFKAKLTYPSPTLVAYWDVDQVKGLYLEASGAVPLFAFPYPPPLNVLLDAAVGLNFGEGPNPDHPEENAYYAGDGFTHFTLGLSVDLQRTQNLTFSTGARLLAGIDENAKQGEGGQSHGLFLSFWLGTTLLLGRL
jgi:hypothetical protein